MERALQTYLDELKSDIASLVYSEGEGATFEDKFTEYCIEILESIGKSEGARVLSYVHPNNMGGIEWKINGYGLKDEFKNENNKTYYGTLDLFITHFKNDDYTYKFNDTRTYDKCINQIKKFILEAFKKQINYIDKSNYELYELIKILEKQATEFDRINIYLFINGFSDIQKNQIEIKGLDTNVFVHTWDIDRLYKINKSNSTHEPIEIEFKKFDDNNKGLQCLQVPSIDDMYDCFLAIVPGTILAKLYKEFSNELLESNVRAFLGQTGKFNKGIRDTIRTKPHMFLPYNNGITATAENIETEFIDNQLTIVKLNDFQIVNGGQTTASLYHTQKKYKDADLSKIFVQMKLTVIKDKDLKNIEVQNISRFANSQNKVSELDLSSNNPYFIQIETLSRKKYVINPDNKNQSRLWFFERANGQYRETLNKQTPAQQKKFKEQNPSTLKLGKSDIAKYINLWDLEPHMVSQGSQKNFIHYTKKLKDLVAKNQLPNDNFYKKLIANAILFKAMDKLFGRKGVDAIGDTNLKSFTVNYTLAYFHLLTNNTVDLWKIYDEQKVNDLLLKVFSKLLVFVYNHLLTEAKSSLMSEYAKRLTSWEILKNTAYPYNLILELQSCLITEDQKKIRDIDYDMEEERETNFISLIHEIRNIGIQFWDGFRNYILKSKLQDFDLTHLEALINKLQNDKNLTASDIEFAQKVFEYINDNDSLVSQIKLLSQLENTDLINIKEIYQMLLTLSKDKWSDLIAHAEERHIFDNLELDNIKSIQMALIKKERIKEQSLIKAFQSLNKLNVFEELSIV